VSIPSRYSNEQLWFSRAKQCHCEEMRKKADSALAIVGYIPLYALCCVTPEVGDTHLQGQVAQHGHVVNRSGRGMFSETSQRR